jgi:meiotically up-regulated gene 157 (Mug157) protein
MTTRREFIKKGSLGLVAAAASPEWIMGQTKISSNGMTYVSKRPALARRNFSSKSVDQTIERLKSKIKDPKLAWMFENCYPNTLDTTVKFSSRNGKPDTFVITGDIDAMWLRDSSAQVWPYLPLTAEDAHLREMIAGVIHHQAQCILIDPYANAFNHDPKPNGEWMKDYTKMNPMLHERKWEIDSLCYPVRLSYNYWKTTNNTSVFDDDWKNAMHSVLKTFREQQRKNDLGPYSFRRVTDRQLDTVCNDGFGNPVNPVGLIVSSFRPSDDATTFGFLVPSNFFAVISLRQIAEISEKVTNEKDFATACRSLANEVEEALHKYAVHTHPKYGKIYAFEVDGFGNQYIMDDANVPSLLGLPYLGAINNSDPIYQNTRKFVWSKDNPYFFEGKAGHGIGGPHIGYDMIWPMSIIMHAMTSSNDEEIRQDIRMLRDTDGDTGFMHESFHKDDPSHFTRKWFAWANTLFGELMVKLEKENKLNLLKS